MIPYPKETVTLEAATPLSMGDSSSETVDKQQKNESLLFVILS